MHIKFDVPYGDHDRLKADIYTPSRPSRTVVIFWHGGSWQRGDKRTYRFIGRALARLGFIAVLPNYRLYPEVAFPVFAEDAAAVVAWVHRELTPVRIVAMGHSAGGQIAASVAYDSVYLEAAGAPGAINGFIGLAGGYSFTPARSLRRVLENGDRPWKSVELISKSPVPSLLMHGQIDAIVPIASSRELASTLRQRGGQVTTAFFPHLNHFTILAPFLLGWWTLPSYKRHIAAFVDSL